MRVCKSSSLGRVPRGFLSLSKGAQPPGGAALVAGGHLVPCKGLRRWGTADHPNNRNVTLNVMRPKLPSKMQTQVAGSWMEPFPPAITTRALASLPRHTSERSAISGQEASGALGLSSARSGFITLSHVRQGLHRRQWNGHDYGGQTGVTAKRRGCRRPQ